MSLNDLEHLLFQLNDFPLLPVGAGTEGKAPVDNATGEALDDWPSKHFTPDQILGFNGKTIAVGTQTGPIANYLLIIDIDGKTAVERCKAAGALARNAGWVIRRDTDEHRLKVAFYIPPELRNMLTDTNGEPIGKVVLPTQPPVYDLDADGNPKRDAQGRLIKLAKQEALELFYGSGQCIVLGKHKPSNGNYTWDGSPIQLREPDEAWLGLIKKILSANKSAERKHAKGSGTTIQSGPSHPCRICGRNTSSACTEYTDGDRVRINCLEGQTFSPPTGLTKGATTSINGITWAYAGDGFNKDIGVFHTFVEHIEQQPAAEPQSAAQGNEFKGTPWIKKQLQECLVEGLSAGEMATEVARIAAEAEVYPATVKDVLAGLRTDEADSETAADLTDLIAEVNAAEQAVEAIALADYFPPKLTAALQTFQRGIPYKDATLLVAQLVQISSTLKLGTRIDGNPMSGWEVPLNLYGVSVGPSGARKTPLLKGVFSKPSELIRSELNKLNAQRFEVWEEECKGKKQNKPTRPIALCHVTNDYTGEALADQLSAHEQHKLPLTILRDEIAALFDSFGKYKQGGKGTGGDEQQILETFDGDAFSSLRCGGGRSYEKCHVSMYGGIQDAVLRRLIAAGDANGKWARCIFVPLPEMTYLLPEPTVEGIAQRRAAESFLKNLSSDLFKLAPRVYELDDEATAALIQYDHLCQQQRSEAAVEAIKALKNKSAGKALRIAGLLHILHCHEQDEFTTKVPISRLAQAITLIDTLDAWTTSFHATAALSAADAQAVSNREQLLRRIHEIAAKNKGTVPWKNISLGLNSRERQGLTAAMAKVMLQTLHDRGIGELTTGKRGGCSYRALGPFQ